MFANNAAVAQLPHSPRSEAEGGTGSSAGAISGRLKSKVLVHW